LGIHFSSKHNLDRTNYENMFKFLLYGITFINFAKFDEDQKLNKNYIMRHCPETDLDYKCPIALCKNYCSEPPLWVNISKKLTSNLEPETPSTFPHFGNSSELMPKTKRAQNFMIS
jgi:hypothetical protein